MKGKRGLSGMAFLLDRENGKDGNHACVGILLLAGRSDCGEPCAGNLHVWFLEEFLSFVTSFEGEINQFMRNCLKRNWKFESSALFVGSLKHR